MPVRGATAQADLVAQEDRADVPGWPQAQNRVADQLPCAATLGDSKQRLGHQPAVAGEGVRGSRRGLERDLPGDVHLPAEKAVTEADANVAHRESEGGLGSAECGQVAGLVQRQRELREQRQLVVEACRELCPASDPRVDPGPGSQADRLVAQVEPDLELERLLGIDGRTRPLHPEKPIAAAGRTQQRQVGLRRGGH